MYVVYNNVCIFVPFVEFHIYVLEALIVSSTVTVTVDSLPAQDCSNPQVLYGIKRSAYLYSVILVPPTDRIHFSHYYTLYVYTGMGPQCRGNAMSDMLTSA